MNLIQRVFCWCSPKRYCRWMLNRTRRQNVQQLKAARALSEVEQENLRLSLQMELMEWHEWLEEMEHRDLVQKAMKMDVYLDDIPAPFPDPEEHAIGHYRLGPFGNELLRPQSLGALTKAMRERAPIYRKERREVADLWLKAGTIITGVIGSATGLVAILKK